MQASKRAIALSSGCQITKTEETHALKNSYSDQKIKIVAQDARVHHKKDNKNENTLLIYYIVDETENGYNLSWEKSDKVNNVLMDFLKLDNDPRDLMVGGILFHNKNNLKEPLLAYDGLW